MSVLFCQTNSPKPKDTCFIIICNRDEKQILTSEEPKNHVCVQKNDVNSIKNPKSILKHAILHLMSAYR